MYKVSSYLLLPSTYFLSTRVVTIFCVHIRKQWRQTPLTEEIQSLLWQLLLYWVFILQHYKYSGFLFVSPLTDYKGWQYGQCVLQWRWRAEQDLCGYQPHTWHTYEVCPACLLVPCDSRHHESSLFDGFWSASAWECVLACVCNTNHHLLSLCYSLCKRV